MAQTSSSFAHGPWSRGLDLGPVDEGLNHLGRNIFTLSPFDLLLLLHFNARSLPRGPMPGDERPERKGGHVDHRTHPMRHERHGNHDYPEDREPSVDAPHEHRVPLDARPQGFNAGHRAPFISRT